MSSYAVVIYDKDGTVIETYSLGDVVDTAGGHDVYLVDGQPFCFMRFLCCTKSLPDFSRGFGFLFLRCHLLLQRRPSPYHQISMPNE